MYLIGKINVTSILPDRLARLKDIANNLWWSWNPAAIDLFREIDLPLWEKLGKNPVRFLQELSSVKIEEKLEDYGYMQRYEEVVRKFDSYMSDTDTWFARNFPGMKNHVVAYFSAEFGLNEVLPVYSGGLGVLSGDYCKAASDLGIPFAAIGLFYKQGYFNQHINADGWQETDYPILNVSQLPVKPVTDEKGEHVHISVEFPGRMVYAKIWQVKIGRVPLYLMDSDTERNSPADRTITARLYGGDQETRIQQEILLGIGGVRVLKALGINATVYHMNEGHSAFLGLELIRELIKENNIAFRAAIEAAASSLVFTTHTPVPAGNDVFPVHMVDRYFNGFWGHLGINRHEFLSLGLKANDGNNFNMTVLALTLAGYRNGVSELHGAVTRSIFNDIWPDIPEEEVPITHVTNGIHTLTWLSPNIASLFDKCLEKGWHENLYCKTIWEKIDDMPDEDLWKTHLFLKEKMINFIRLKLKEQMIKNGEPLERIRGAENILDPDALTIGFARRFATYKRANLIFGNFERIKRILNTPGMPVQIIFAGKAHPADRPAHEVIKHIHDISRQEGFAGKVVLVENYNMTLARNLVQGVDIWLNNPRRPLEASGTSGQKAAINGIINFSILDGWWCEGYNGKNGWAIGGDNFYSNEYCQDNADSESLYDILENHIMPLFYQRNEYGIPTKWTKIMKESIKSLVSQYSTHRMLQDYLSKMYLPSMERVDKIAASNYGFASKLADWKLYMRNNWHQVGIKAGDAINRLRELRTFSSEPLEISVLVNLGSIKPSDVKVEIYYGAINKCNMIDNPEIVELNLEENKGGGVYLYSTIIKLLDGGEYGYTFRVVPHHADLINRFDLRLIRWAT